MEKLSENQKAAVRALLDAKKTVEETIDRVEYFAALQELKEIKKLLGLDQ